MPPTPRCTRVPPAYNHSCVCSANSNLLDGLIQEVRPIPRGPRWVRSWVRNSFLFNLFLFSDFPISSFFLFRGGGDEVALVW
ncbi:hypothetical protein COCVIDRAFT_91620 [Bipolaris victoriae FI3]|uniref:Uncharacterized protein n=1 Tax=Bipolaris victoriae (strain FI3) TaxID=930091 RepID=W7EPH8_BIPV3|nr:hypothetical protein COCVIDRAFT_91620 [Bipolaris victoriae FI3]